MHDITMAIRRIVRTGIVDSIRRFEATYERVVDNAATPEHGSEGSESEFADLDGFVDTAGTLINVEGVGDQLQSPGQISRGSFDVSESGGAVSRIDGRDSRSTSPHSAAGSERELTQ